MGRQERRRDERKQRKADEEAKRRAALSFQRDMKKVGSYDEIKAMNDRFYLANVLEKSETVKRGWDRNGITHADVEAAFERGKRKASDNLADRYEEMVYASAAIAMKRVLKLDMNDIASVLDEMYRIVTEEPNLRSLVKQCEKETGLVLEFRSIQEAKSYATMTANLKGFEDDEEELI